MPIRTNHHAGQWFMGPSASSVPPKVTQMSQFILVGLIVGVSGLLSESKGQDDGLGPRPVSQRSGVLGVIGRRSLSHRI